MKSIFISHASEDKDLIARPLAEELRDKYSVWYDEYQLVLGSSLFEDINKGLAECDYGIVILSHSFFNKKWPQHELNALFSLEDKNKKIILPVWHNISYEEIRNYSPILSDRLSVNSNEGIPVIVKEINRAIESFNRGVEVQRNSSSTKFQSSLVKAAEKRRSNKIIPTYEGVAITLNGAKSTVSQVMHLVNELSEISTDLDFRVEGPEYYDTRCFVELWSGDICLRIDFNNNIVNTAKDATLTIEISKPSAGFHAKNEDIKIFEREVFSPYITNEDSVYWESKSNELLKPSILVELWINKFSEFLNKL